MAFTEYMIGKREQISWGDETTYGTAVTPTEIVGKDVVVTPNFSKGYQEVLSAGADSREIEGLVAGPEDLRFTLEFIPVNWKWLKYVFGSVSDGGSGPYTHDFSLSNTVQSFTLEWAKRGSTNHVITLAGCVVTRATVRFSKATGAGRDGHIRVSLDCVAKTLSTGTTITTLSPPTAIPFQYRMVKFTLDGSEIPEVNNGEIVFDNTIDPNDSRYCNATYDKSIGEPIPKTFRISGRINVNIKDSTYFDLWDAETAVSGSTKLEFIRGADDDLDLTFSDFFVLDAVAPTNIEGVTNTDIVFQSLSVSATATDDIETY